MLAEGSGTGSGVGSDKLAGNGRAEDEEGCDLNHCVCKGRVFGRLSGRCQERRVRRR